jgi:hypothetical protein
MDAAPATQQDIKSATYVLPFDVLYEMTAMIVL